MASDNGGSGFVTGFLFGGALGVLVGLLIAPRAGEELRTELLERSLNLREQAETLANQARHRAEDVTQEARGRAEDIAHEARTRAEELAAQARTRVRGGNSTGGTAYGETSEAPEGPSGDF